MSSTSSTLPNRSRQVVTSAPSSSQKRDLSTSYSTWEWRLAKYYAMSSTRDRKPISSYTSHHTMSNEASGYTHHPAIYYATNRIYSASYGAVWSTSTRSGLTPSHGSTSSAPYTASIWRDPRRGAQILFGLRMSSSTYRSPPSENSSSYNTQCQTKFASTSACWLYFLVLSFVAFLFYVV